ncbi:MAG: hypothetical protein HY897_07710 [Deltaproteobacteria bacterium]|nr:hypothetical protein [Deltaproteobacteria bacterium]
MGKIENMLNRRPDGCLSELAAEMFLCGGLSGDKNAAAETHLRDCPHCAAMLERMEGSVGGWRPDAGLIRRRQAPVGLFERLASWLGRPAVLIPVAALSAILVAVPVLLYEKERPGAVRPKGGVSLRLFEKTEGGARPGIPGEALKAGDTIKFAVQPGGHRYVMVVNIEEGGGLALYYPKEGDGIIHETDRETVLPGSITLDDFKGRERVFAVFSDAPLRFAEVSAAAARLPRAGGTLDLEHTEALPLDLPQASVLIRKE